MIDESTVHDPLPALLLDSVTQSVIATDPRGTVVFWNAGAQRLFGWTREEAVGRPVVEVTLPASWVSPGVVAEVAAGRTWSSEITACRKDGSTFAAEVTNTPVVGPDGRVVAVVGVATDVSGRLAEEARSSRLSAVVESSTDAILSVAPDATVLSWNPAAQRLYGWTAAEVLGRPVGDLLPADVRPALQELLDAVLRGEPVPDRETWGYRRDGTAFAVELRLSPVHDRLGRVVGVSATARDVSERAALRAAAEADRERLVAAQELAEVSSCEVDLLTGACVWSASTWTLLGVDPEPDAPVDRFLAAVHPEDGARVHAVLADLRAGVQPPVQEYRVQRPDGSARWVRESFAVRRDPDGRALSALGTKLDITEIRRAETGLRDAEAYLRLSFERSAIGMTTSDLEGRITLVNPAFLEIVGRSEADVTGRRAVAWMHPDDVAAARTPREEMLAGQQLTYESEHRVLRPDGSVVWVLKTVSLVRAADGSPSFFVSQLQDITARRDAEAQLAHQAFHDPLTGLPNRLLLADRIEHALARAGRGDGGVAALFLDVDQFKVVNDGIGHAAGDELLVQVAARLRSVVRPGDTLARFGGDEFVVVCEGMAREDLAALADRVGEAVRAPFRLDGRDVVVTVSTGVAEAGPGADAGSLLRDADAAMYRAKAGGRDCVVVFDDAMHRQAADRLDTELELRHALERGQLVLHYQPVLDLRTERVVGVEALVRWEHPGRGLLPPAAFVGLAEQTGLILPIGEWVLDEALRRAQRWRAELPGAAGLWVAVNISARQVQAPGLVEGVRAALERSGIDPAGVHLEMTESVVMNDGELCLDALDGLRGLGVQLSVDDFGTGYSSLSYLKRLPVDSLKVDRSFVDGLGTDDVDRSIVNAVLNLAGALDLVVVAEGVESAQQRDELREMGLHLAQGHFWSPAVPPDALEAWLTARG